MMVAVTERRMSYEVMRRTILVGMVSKERWPILADGLHRLEVFIDCWHCVLSSKVHFPCSSVIKCRLRGFQY